MRNRVFVLIALMVLAGCTTELSKDIVEVRPVSEMFSATIENPDTKVYVDGNLKTHWNEGDEISIFTTTYNQHFKFDGQTGDSEGTFTELSNQFFTGGEIPTVYAVYPYNENTSVTTEGVITLNLPAVQHYAADSYGLGANTMVAATENMSSRALKFKSLCGYVVVRLYGDATIKSITLSGNNGEKLSGQATVAPIYGQDPVITMSESAETSIKLDCGEGVELGKTADEATAFWFAVPPVTFTLGFTIRVTNVEGYSMEKTTHAERTVVRNIKNPLAALAVTDFPIAPEGNIVFEDENFKAYCVQNFDKDGDGEVSYNEAHAVTRINVLTTNISSLSGIEHFSNLTDLFCSGGGSNWNEQSMSLIGNGLLTSLDVSKNKELLTLDCSGNKLETINLSGCSSLQYLSCSVNHFSTLDISQNEALLTLDCSDNKLTAIYLNGCLLLQSLSCHANQLTSLDVSNNKALTQLLCMSNQLSSLDVRNNTVLTNLQCNSNQLTSLDLRNNEALTLLNCSINQLTYLDVSNNTALSYLRCNSNQLTYLDVSNNKALDYLDCSSNQLTSLEVSNNKALTGLECFSNQLTTLDVSNNTELKLLKCSENQLATLDISGCSAMRRLWCSNNNLTTLNSNGCEELNTLYCFSNLLTSLDVRSNNALSLLHCYDNPYLTQILLKTGQTISNFSYDMDVATLYIMD
jgi:hypothetical protein